MAHPPIRIFAYICFTIFFAFSCSTSEKTSENPTLTKENVKVVTETSPAIIGGIDMLYQQLEYPSNAQKNTSVTLHANVLINKKGMLEKISFDEDRYGPFKSAARKALRQVRFVPGKQNGQAVDMYIAIPISFGSE